ncbi:MAG: hypothetical protein RLT05_24220 [Bauldia litoralis]
MARPGGAPLERDVLLRARPLRRGFVSAKREENRGSIVDGGSREDAFPTRRCRFAGPVSRHRADSIRPDSEPETGNGKCELRARARAIEKGPDRARAGNPDFADGRALSRIAVVEVSACHGIGSPTFSM